MIINVYVYTGKTHNRKPRPPTWQKVDVFSYHMVQSAFTERERLLWRWMMLR